MSKEMKRMRLQVVLAGMAIWGAAAQAQSALGLREAIDRALGMNPEAAAAQAGVDEAQAGVALARTALLPQIRFTEDMSKGDDPVYAFGTRLRQQRFAQANFAIDSLNRPEPIGDFSSRISGGWQLFDSLRTQKQIEGARHMRKSAVAQAGAVNQKIVFDVVAAYQQILYGERAVAMARHQLETAEALERSADDHVKAGLAVESDQMAAAVNVAACRQALIAAEGDRALAWDGLRLAMGAPEQETVALQPLAPRSYPASSLEEDLALAAEHRKDLQALDEVAKGQKSAVSAARGGFGPQVNLYGNWENDRASLASAGGTNWVAGVQIGLDLQPLTRRAQLAQQKAQQARAEAQARATRQQIRLQVSQAHTAQATAREAMQAAQAAVGQAHESLRIVKNRYEAGLATITDLLRAEDAARLSETNYWRAVYGNLMAHAQLLFATGMLTPDAAEVLQ